MKVLSLFDGISCGMVALQRAGIPVERYVAYEIDKYAVQVSEKNYPSIEHCGDVFDGDFTQYKGFGLLLGGSPCTFWSIAKVRWGREVTPDGMGGKLFMEYVRALRESGCRYFLYENNYSIHKDIKDFISKQLGVQPITINSALVSAQVRKRCYWTNIPNISQPEDKGILFKDIIEDGLVWKDKAYCVLCSYNGAVIWNTLKRCQRSMVAINREYGKYTVERGEVRIAKVSKPNEVETFKINLPDGKYDFRKLTITELERLQTLPEGYTGGVLINHKLLNVLVMDGLWT